MEIELTSEIVRYASAKLTLTLRMLEKRSDGYNDLEAFTVFLPSISDQIKITEDDTKTSFEVVSEDDVPADHSNLVNKAIEIFLDHERIADKEKVNLNFDLTKIIPMAAGLGGGSADAAATLNALNFIYNDELTTTELMYMAAELGSDVTPCLYSQALIMRGRGDLIDLVDDFFIDELHALIVTPKITCSTPEVYSHYDKLGRPKDEGIQAHKQLNKYIEYHVNDLAIAAYDLYPDLKEIKNQLEASTGLSFVLAGSGSSFFAIEEPDNIIQAKETLLQSDYANDFRLCENSTII